MKRILLILLVELSIFCDPIFAKDLVKIKAEVCVVGAGSAGIGAALAASCAGALLRKSLTSSPSISIGFIKPFLMKAAQYLNLVIFTKQSITTI